MKKSKKFTGMMLLFGGIAIAILILAMVFKGDSSAADPIGASYVSITGAETLGDVATTANKALLGSNYVWIMICGFLVFFFQCGFAMVETGFCRAKNAAHTITMNFMVFLVGAVGYFLVGAMAERVKYSASVITSFFIAIILYPLFANWVWGGGWLSTLGKNFGIGHGVVDFAGSAVVHTMGGMIALAGAIVLGPRIGKFKKDGTARAFPGHNIPMAIIGTIILFFCWFAFNAGSTLSSSDFRLSVVATNTMIAGAVGGLVAMFYMWIKFGKPDPSMTANGALAGLVAITAPCAFVNGISALIIGFTAGILVCLAVPFVENKLKLDDPVGAISVHGVNGLWGVIALGLFADGTYGDGLNGVSGGVRGLLFGDASQFLAQLIAVAVLFTWGFGVSLVFFKVLDKVWGLRVAPEDELEGLDVPEMGVLAYPDSMLTRSELDYDSADNAQIKQLLRFNYYDKTEIPYKNAQKKLEVRIDHAVPVEVISTPATTLVSDIKLTKIDIITKQSKFEALKEAMNSIGISGMTVTQVLGCGIQKGKTEYYRGVETEINLLPKVQVEIVVAKVPVRKVIETAKKVLYTGHIGDGKIFVYDVENVVKVRTGEEGYDALQDVE